MTVYHSSHFFPTSPAGSGNSNVQYLHTKATVGLGLGLPSDVLVTNVHEHTGVGLGIFIDCWFLDDDIESPEPASVSPTMPSPPLLAPRRSPRKPPAQTPGSEFAPMRTPSPSLRGHVGGAVLALPTPSVPTLPNTPTLPSVPFAGVGAGVGLGIDIPGLDAFELGSSFREIAGAGAKAVGLGLSLPCLDEAELITTFEPQSTSHASIRADLSFLEDDADSDCELESALPSPWSHPASPVHVSCAVETAHPKPTRAYAGLGFDLSGDGGVQGVPDGDSPNTSPREPTLGFDSPFWATYASTFHEAC